MVHQCADLAPSPYAVSAETFNAGPGRHSGYAETGSDWGTPSCGTAAPEGGFDTLIDIMNPLQHIPIVGTIYRELTGDTISPVARVAGGGLYGGPLGLVIGAFSAVIEQETGKDPVGLLGAALFDAGSAPGSEDRLADAAAAPAGPTRVDPTLLSLLGTGPEGAGGAGPGTAAAVAGGAGQGASGPVAGPRPSVDIGTVQLEGIRSPGAPPMPPMPPEGAGGAAGPVRRQGEQVPEALSGELPTLSGPSYTLTPDMIRKADQMLREGQARQAAAVEGRRAPPRAVPAPRDSASAAAPQPEAPPMPAANTSPAISPAVPQAASPAAAPARDAGTIPTAAADAGAAPALAPVGFKDAMLGGLAKYERMIKAREAAAKVANGASAGISS